MHLKVKAAQVILVDLWQATDQTGQFRKLQRLDLVE
jgi:hypothetical protein